MERIENLASKIDATCLKPTTNFIEYTDFIYQSLLLGVRCIIVPPWTLELVTQFIDTQRFGTVIGFPLGFSQERVKIAEVFNSLIYGAKDIDMVINIQAVKFHHYATIIKEIQEAERLVHSGGGILKIIIETCYLTKSEVVEISKIVRDCGADYIKTSTGFGSDGVHIYDIQNILEAVGHTIGIKASGGIQNLRKAKTMLDAGADIIGTSHAVTILRENHYEGN